MQVFVIIEIDGTGILGIFEDEVDANKHLDWEIAVGNARSYEYTIVKSKIGF